MSTSVTPRAPQGNAPVLGIPDSQDIPRLVYTAPYFVTVPLAELIEPSVIESVESLLPSLLPPYVDQAAAAAVQQLAVLLTGSTMTGPLFLNPVMPTQPSQAASMAYVDAMVATAGVPEVPPVPAGQTWARQTGQWVPVSETGGVFLPLAGGAMQGQINMSGNAIINLPTLPVMPNGAAPAQWVLNQIAASSLYQGTWNMDTYTPDLTQPSTHQNGFTWIAITTSTTGVVIGPAIPGLQGQTIFNGDTVIYSAIQGVFNRIHAGGLTLDEANALFLALNGGQMQGALLLNANATQPTQATTLQQVQGLVAGAGIGEAPNDGQLYGRSGLTASWLPVLPLAGGLMTGMITLAGNATQPLQPTTLQQQTSAISGAVAGYLPLAGGTMSGLMQLSGNATNALNPVSLQQMNATIGSTVQNYLPLTGGTLSGPLAINNATALTITGASVSDNSLSVLNGRVVVGSPADLSQGIFYNAPTLIGGGNGFAFGADTTTSTSVMGVNVAVNGAQPAGSGTWLITSIWVPGTAAPVLRMTSNSGVTQMTAILNGASSATWSIASSDGRLKHNQAEPDKDALGIVHETPVYQCDYQHPAASDSEHLDFTIVAQDVRRVLPHAYIPPPDEHGYASLHPLHLIATLWRAVQQLTARLEVVEGHA